MLVLALVGATKSAIDRLTIAQLELLRPGSSLSLDEFRRQRRADGIIIGSADDVVDQLGMLGELGLQEAVFQHTDTASEELPEFLASEIIPRVAGL